MSASPMRSVIRILANSPLVEKISLDHEHNNVKIYYKNDAKNSDSIREMVDVINYYFENKLNSPNALMLMGKKEEVVLKTIENYHFNTYTSSLFEIYRIDMQDTYLKNNSYYDLSSDIVEVELICLEHAKDFIFSELRKKESARRCVVEVNYTNFKDAGFRRKYIQQITMLPQTIARRIDISLIRIPPEDDLAEINTTLEYAARLSGDACLSLYFNDNFPLVETALSSDASKIFLTVDFKVLQDDKTIEKLHEMIKEHPKSKNVFVIQYNVDKDSAKMIGKSSNTLRYTGRQAIRRA